MGVAPGSMVNRPYDCIVKATWSCVFGCSTSGCTALAPSESATSCTSWLTVCSRLCDTLFAVSVSCDICLCASIATRCERYETTLPFDGKIPPKRDTGVQVAKPEIKKNQTVQGQQMSGCCV